MHSHSGGAGLFRYSSIPSVLSLASLLHCSRHPCLPEKDTSSLEVLEQFAPAFPDCTLPLAAMGSVPRFSARLGQGLLLPAGGPRAARAAERKGGQLGAGSPAGPGQRCGGQSAALRCAFWHGPGPLLSR